MRYSRLLAYFFVALGARPLAAQPVGGSPVTALPASVEAPMPASTATPGVVPEPVSPDQTPEVTTQSYAAAPVPESPVPGQPQAHAPETVPVLAQPATEAWAATPPQLSSMMMVRGAVRIQRHLKDFTWGLGLLALANVHWLDQPANRAVSVGNFAGRDDRYPGFTGGDITLGAMLDVRYLRFIGVEVDLFRQNDRGTGTIAIKDAGSLCFIPGVRIPYVTSKYDVTIGQYAWHVPVLLKLAIASRTVIVQHENEDQEIVRGFTTFAFGPEFVFPTTASFRVSPERGLDYPLQASASNYVMYTGALGYERRLSDSRDLRLLLSLRGSYNPNAGSGAMERGEYIVNDSNVVPITYKSEWRYQAAITLGLGWFF